MKNFSRRTALLVATLAVVGCASLSVGNSGVDRSGPSVRGVIGPANVAAQVNHASPEISAVRAPVAIEATVIPSENAGAPEISEQETMRQLGNDLTELAKDVELAALQTKIAALEAAKARLEAAVAKADAKIAAAEESERQFRSEVANDLRAVIGQIDGVSAQNVTTAPETVAVVSVATFTAATPAEGWYAWKRQSAAYKKAYPWEGSNGVWCSNATRAGIPCTEEAWKKVPAGTVFLLPAPEVRVYVQKGMQAPEAIMLAPTANPELFKLDPSVPVVTKNLLDAQMLVANLLGSLGDAQEKARWVPVLSVISAVSIILALFFGFKYLEERDLVRDRDEMISRLRARLDGINQKTGEFLAERKTKGDCCRRDPPEGLPPIV